MVGSFSSKWTLPACPRTSQYGRGTAPETGMTAAASIRVGAPGMPVKSRATRSVHFSAAGTGAGPATVGAALPTAAATVSAAAPARIVAARTARTPTTARNRIFSMVMPFVGAPSHLGDDAARPAGAPLPRHHPDEQLRAAARYPVQVGQIFQREQVGAEDQVVHRGVGVRGGVDADRVDGDAADLAVFQQPLGGVRAEAGKMQVARRVAAEEGGRVVHAALPPRVHDDQGAVRDAAVAAFIPAQVRDLDLAV